MFLFALCWVKYLLRNVAIFLLKFDSLSEKYSETEEFYNPTENLISGYSVLKLTNLINLKVKQIPFFELKLLIQFIYSMLKSLSLLKADVEY